MEAEAAKIPDRSQRFSLIRGHHSLRSIFHHKKSVFFGNLHDLIHLAAHAGIMNHRNRFRPLRNRCFNLIFIDIHRIRANIHKHSLRSPEYKSICRGNKSVRRHNYLIPRFDIRQQSGHF